jgi:riboflavin synthase
MFTGIVRETGEIISKEQSPEGATFEVRCREIFPDLRVSHSVSIDGVCLTVVERGEASFKVQAVPETLRLTNLGDRQVGDAVNLEPAARLSDFLGGHLVQGHVDGRGEVVSVRPEGNSQVFRFAAPPQVLNYCVMKGSIAVNGVSLTISGLGPGYFEVTIIPHTSEITNFGILKVGDLVNLEADVISKYVESHVRRVVGAITIVALLSASVLGGSLPVRSQSVLVYQQVVAKKERPFILRVARFHPDAFLEWESTTAQGTVHLHKKAVEGGRRFCLERLFEPGVDNESSDTMTVWLSRRAYRELTEKGAARIDFNSLPLRLWIVEKRAFRLSVDKKPVEVQSFAAEDDRKNRWRLLEDPDNPLLLEYETPHFRQYLKSITTTAWPGLRWIKSMPPVK